MKSDTVILRRDAQVRRERLIEAAIDMYARHGFDVPLEKIAEEAGVSRPTLYRNFPDREALTTIVVQALLDQVAVEIEEMADRDDAFILSVRLVAERTLMSGGMSRHARPEQSTPQARKFVNGLQELMTEPLERAKKAGLVRRDFQLVDTRWMILMIAGAGYNQPDPRATMDKALKLLLEGLTPR